MSGALGALRRVGARVLYRDPATGEEAPAWLAWARPLSGRGGSVSILSADKRRELAFVDDLARLDEASRRVALDELEQGLVMPRVTKVLATEPRRGGHWYWKVETDRGPTDFLIGSPDTNAIWPSEDACILRDTLGNAYEIPSLAALDDESRRRVGRVL